ncbi:MAG: hypothetical protein ACOC56_02845, partial [Atribacterota bacterium]
EGEKEKLGGIAGENSGEIYNINMNSFAIGGYYKVGGIAGENSGEIYRIEKKSKTVQGVSYVGGIVGKNTGYIYHSYNNGTVSGHTTTGGIAGRNEESITNSYNSGGVSSLGSVGGITQTNTGTIKNCYSIGELYSDLEKLETDGGIADTNEGSVTASYYNTETTGVDSSAGGEAKTTSEMKEYSLYNGNDWDITQISDESNRDTYFIWNIVNEETYPFFSFQGSVVETNIITPYLINPFEDFNISYETIENINLSNHFNNSQDYTLYIDSTDGEYNNVPIGEDSSYTFEYVENDSLNRYAKVTLTTNNILKIESYSRDYGLNITVEASNNNGESEDKFTTYIVENSTNPYSAPEGTEEIEENPPEITSSIDDFTLPLNSEVTIKSASHFSNVDSTYIIYYSPLANSEFRIDEGESEKLYSIHGIETSEISLNNDGEMTIKTYDVITDNVNLTDGHHIKFYAVNDDGKVLEDFNYKIDEEENIEEDEEYIEPVKETVSTGFLGGISGSFLSLLPSSADLSTGQALAIVFISMAILTFIFIIVSYSSTGTLPPAMIFLIITLNSLLFLFFIAVGYVPISVIIFIVLVLIGVSFLKIKSIFSGGGNE